MRAKHISAFTILILFTALLTSGCQQTQMPASNSGALPRIAVLPFDNYSSDPNAGLVIMSSLQTALSAKKANLIPPGDVREKLMPYQGSYLPPKKLGSILGATMVVCGDVNEYRYVYGTGEQPSVAYNIRIIDVKTGAQIWNKALSETGNFSWLREGSLGKVVRESAASAATDIIAALKKSTK